MREYITGERIYGKLRMLRSLSANKCFLLVEGDTDSRLYGKFIDNETSEIVIADNKDNVIEAIEKCNNTGFKGTLGVVDSDFWKLDKVKNIIDNLFVTDYHDLECMLVNSQAYESVFAEYVDRNKYNRFVEERKSYPKDVALKNGAIIGYLRWYSQKYNLGLKFDNLDFRTFTDTKELEIDIEKLVNQVIGNSKSKKKLNNVVVKEELQNLLNKDWNLWHVCCGHDIIEILSIGFINIFGSYNAKNLFPGSLEGSFRLAYEYTHFFNTKLYKSLLKWEESNPQYNIFIDHIALEAV
ncbi:hypothetical protein B2H86_17120 [Clostridium botulinum]|uniref:DUF4435 domain-containing protein n=1 Tax=Clostridium botulinum TaxID=1491 RepID=UPI000A170FFC|nr:DUF4435 domain-containing protein [Clostridium botulinum]OSA72282.1 hypothetical protein B2H86_17120 [Clostridium botulinum]